MRDRRAMLVLGVLVVALGLAGYGGWRHFFGLPVGVSPDGFARINRDMTMPEVVSVFGKPPDWDDDLSLTHPYYSTVAVWYAEDRRARVTIYFDRCGNVRSKRFTAWTNDERARWVRPTLHRRVQRLLGW